LTGQNKKLVAAEKTCLSHGDKMRKGRFMTATA